MEEEQGAEPLLRDTGSGSRFCLLLADRPGSVSLEQGLSHMRIQGRVSGFVPVVVE